MRSFAWCAMLAVLTGICLSDAANAQSSGGLAGGIVETDADHFTAVRLRVAGLSEFTSSLEYRGIAVQNTTYSQSGWRKNAGGIAGLWRSQDRASLAGVNAELGLVRVAGRLRPIGDIVWSMRPAAGTGIELLAAAGLIETQAAIGQGIGFSFWGASVEQQLAPHLTAIVLFAYQPFTDGNDRSHFRGRLIWDVLPDEGINLQAQWREYHSAQSGISGAYFDPDRYRQWLAVAGFRKRLSGWTTMGGLGAGRETIRNVGVISQPAYLAELRAERAIGGLRRRMAAPILLNRQTP